MRSSFGFPGLKISGQCEAAHLVLSLLHRHTLSIDFFASRLWDNVLYIIRYHVMHTVKVSWKGCAFLKKCPPFAYRDLQPRGHRLLHRRDLRPVREQALLQAEPRRDQVGPDRLASHGTVSSWGLQLRRQDLGRRGMRRVEPAELGGNLRSGYKHMVNKVLPLYKSQENDISTT